MAGDQVQEERLGVGSQSGPHAGQSILKVGVKATWISLGAASGHLQEEVGRAVCAPGCIKCCPG